MAPIDSVAPEGVFLKVFAATNHQIKMVATVPMLPEIHFLLIMAGFSFLPECFHHVHQRAAQRLDREEREIRWFSSSRWYEVSADPHQ